MSELVPAELAASYAPQLEIDRGLIALCILRLSGGSPTQVEREARSLRTGVGMSRLTYIRHPKIDLLRWMPPRE